MAAQTDLWGDIIPEQVRTPVAILREQATLLGRKTKNLVEARVETDVCGTELCHHFQLVVPVLDGYTYELFHVWHGVDIYPVRVPNMQALKNEDEFTGWLREQLSSPKTTKIIGNLLAQANS